MKMTTTLIAALFALGLVSGPVTARSAETAHPATPSHQRMHADMMGGDMDMGMTGMGMMNGSRMNWQSEQWNRGCMGMMGGFMMSIMSPDQQQQFLDATRDLRHQMLELRFSYLETMRDPKATPADLARIESRMLDVRKQMMAKLEELLNRKIDNN
ncbi:MAG TPA: hypothetical protein ENI89_04485 [Desulfobulbus sp.]|nr:hypothetical protein [Desulfobulbus sp.]